MVHELAHQWFGDSVSLRDWNDVWLNEGFASYAEWLWQGHVSHDQAWARHHFRNLYRVYSADNPFWKLAPADPGSRRRMFDQRVYDRGAMALQALRMRVGNPAFFRIMRTWAKERAYGAGTTPQFKRLAERVSGRQLDQLFRDWLYRPAKPTGY
jgi:aminopeptidase N